MKFSCLKHNIYHLSFLLLSFLIWGSKENASIEVLSYIKKLNYFSNLFITYRILLTKLITIAFKKKKKKKKEVFQNKNWLNLVYDLLCLKKKKNLSRLVMLLNENEM